MCICNKMRFLHIIVSKNGVFWRRWRVMVLPRIASREMLAFALRLLGIYLSVGCAAPPREGRPSGENIKNKKILNYPLKD